jgi:RND family efflux transporter MFP subunit
MPAAETNAVPVSGKRRKWPWAAAILVLAAAAGAWWWSDYAKRQEAQAARRPAAAVTVTTTKVESRDVPVRIKVNGVVTALQSVDLRSQVTSTISQVHIREGQNVTKGELLFTLDSRADEANLRKAQAQVEKDKADLATSERNLARQRELFQQKFIAQAALDVAQNQVDTLKGQIAVDTAAVEAARVAVAYSQIRAPFAGRTGIINVRPGSLVQPSQSSTTTSPPLVTVTQIDPISVAFTLPEKELAGLQQALRSGTLMVSASAQGNNEPLKGKVTFVDNAVDTTTGTIRVKADFSNPEGRLWPGMYATVEISPRTIANASVVPAQAVQSSPEGRFVYQVGEDRKVTPRPVTLAYVEDNFAVVKGVEPGARIVVEGAQNLRPGTAVAEAQREAPETKTGKEEGKKGKRSS